MPNMPDITKLGRKLGTIDAALARKAGDYLILGLKNVNAMAQQDKVMVQAGIEGAENYPELQEKLKNHLGEKNLQLQRSEKILTDLDDRPSGVKDTALATFAGIQSGLATAAEDEILKSCFSLYGLANFEAVAYETLLFFAEEAGMMEAVGPLQECLDEEREMALFLADSLPEIARRFLESEAEGVKISH